jgi:hypothetical protein
VWFRFLVEWLVGSIGCGLPRNNGQVKIAALVRAVSYTSHRGGYPAMAVYDMWLS